MISMMLSVPSPRSRPKVMPLRARARIARARVKHHLLTRVGAGVMAANYGTWCVSMEKKIETIPSHDVLNLTRVALAKRLNKG